MKFSVNKDSFQTAVLKAERMTGKNLSLPVLRCVLLSAEKDSVVIRATNLDLGIEVTVPAQVQQTGVVAVPADILGSLLSSSGNGGTLTVEQEGSHITVTTTHSTTNISTYPREDFPLLPKVNDTEMFIVVGKEFATALRSVVWAASMASIKPELSSVYVYGNGDELVCVATDSFRLAEKRVRAKTGKEFESVLIPLKNSIELIRYTEGLSGDIAFFGDTHQIASKTEDTYITSRVIDGVFPDYKQIIPKEHSTEAVVLKQDLSDTLKQLRIFSDQFNKLTLTINPKLKECVLKTTNNDVGDSTVTLDAALTGESAEMHFNHAYILDALQAIHTDSAALNLSGVGKPLTIRSVGDTSFLYIVMPMNR
ncbi:MAG: DNA polymerase III subunit beta [Patescibacteria group bacterium]